MKLIYTSAWIESFLTKGDKEIRSQVECALRNCEARLTEPVLVDLFHGAQGTKELNLLNSIKESVIF